MARVCKETAEQLPDIRIFYPYVSDGNRDASRYVDIGDRVPPHMAIGLGGDRREVAWRGDIAKKKAAIGVGSWETRRQDVCAKSISENLAE